MAFKRSNLAWTNISRDALATESAREAWDALMLAKSHLESELATEARELGAAQEGDVFKFAYGSIGQGSIGMAIAEPEKAQRGAGFAGLKRPVPQSLDAYNNERDNGGYRR